MSHLLWQHFLSDDVTAFQEILAASTAKSAFSSTSPIVARNRRPGPLSKTINWKSRAGTTLLHVIAASALPSAPEFAAALLQLPLVDLYVQDDESGWTALHRALYNGNTTIAQQLLDRDSQNLASGQVAGLIKVKDHEGYSAFDLYLASIPSPILAPAGDELFVFGSNKNFTLGLGHGDDRQYPERVGLHRPLSYYGDQTFGIFELPAKVRYRPLLIQDVQLSKFHSAVLTTDPHTNLYMCGFGSGGRLGTGDETTQFAFTSVCGGGLAGKRVAQVSLGQDHTIAVSADGDVFTWGSNNCAQLGYTSNDLTLLPRQIFGGLKRETVMGAAASRVHSVVFTTQAVFTFGLNQGQLGLVDSDARSLVHQTAPRRIGAVLFTANITAVSAIEKATACLLQNHDVWVFANYGYSRVSCTVDPFSCRVMDNPVVKIAAAGETIAALTKMGDVFAFKTNNAAKIRDGKASTTNPAKIRDGLSKPQRIWCQIKSHMAVRDVDVCEDDSVIICTAAGSAWHRVPRGNKEYKFSRIPGLTNIVNVRSNAFGGFAAVRRDHGLDFDIGEPTLSTDIARLLPLKQLDGDIEAKLLELSSGSGDLLVGTTSSEARISVHAFLLAGRSPVLGQALSAFYDNYFSAIPDTATLEYDKDGQALLLFSHIDILTLLNIVVFVYTDSVLDVWHNTQKEPHNAFRYRTVRSETMRTASSLQLRRLEQAARLMSWPSKTVHEDLAAAIQDAAYFHNGDLEVQLSGTSQLVHSALVCQRCDFFQGLFEGRASGQWLLSRRNNTEKLKIDLSHIPKGIFDYVLRYLYCDADETMFGEVVSADLDTYLDLVVEVLGVANELMLERLSQSCQKAIAKYVNVRNVCQLLNTVAPCSATDFKDAALRYICLNLEVMLETRLLDELDPELLQDIDQVVRENHRVCLPISKDPTNKTVISERTAQILVDRARLNDKLGSRVPGTTRRKSHDLLDDFDPRPATPSSSPALNGQLMFDLEGCSTPQVQPLAEMQQLSLDVSEKASETWSRVNADQKLTLKDIMAQTASSNGTPVMGSMSPKLLPRTCDQMMGSMSPKTMPRISQKERKRQQQQQQKGEEPESSSPASTPSSPWQIAGKSPRVSLKDVLDSPAESQVRGPSPMTLRQTVAGKAPAARSPVAGISAPVSPHRLDRIDASPEIRSIRHTVPTPPQEAYLNLSMDEIVAQQQTEKEILREAVSKRSLMEIQEEQAFQEWWEQESRKVQASQEEKTKVKPRGNRRIRASLQ